MARNPPTSAPSRPTPDRPFSPSDLLAGESLGATRQQEETTNRKPDSLAEHLSRTASEESAGPHLKRSSLSIPERHKEMARNLREIHSLREAFARRLRSNKDIQGAAADRERELAVKLAEGVEESRAIWRQLLINQGSDAIFFEPHLRGLGPYALNLSSMLALAEDDIRRPSDASGQEREIKRKVGRAMGNARKSRGLSQSMVADAIGMEPETLSRIERGVISATIHRIVQISELLDVPVSRLVDSPAHASDAISEILRSFPKIHQKSAQLILAAGIAPALMAEQASFRASPPPKNPATSLNSDHQAKAKAKTPKMALTVPTNRTIKAKAPR